MKFTIWGKEYEIETHRQGYGGGAFAAACVKCRDIPYVSDEHEQKVDRMTEAGYLSSNGADRLRLQAEAIVQELWWEWAVELAKKYGLGNVYSAGRQGGWLILNDYSSDVLDNIVFESDGTDCGECGEEFSRHERRSGKCLFGPTTYDGDIKYMRQRKHELLKVIRFFKLCERSVASFVPEDLKYQNEFYIDEEWEAFLEWETEQNK